MTAQIWHFSEWITDTDPRSLYVRFNSLLKNAGFHVLRRMEHHFDPFGYTCLFLLAESHFAIHTFPEENKTYIELSSCNKAFFDRFVALLHGGGDDWQKNQV